MEMIFLFCPSGARRSAVIGDDGVEYSVVDVVVDGAWGQPGRGPEVGVRVLVEGRVIKPNSSKCVVFTKVLKLLLILLYRLSL